MFQRIMAPVDLAHLDDLERALRCAGTLARQFGAHVTYVGVTSHVPNEVAHNREEFERKLSDLARREAEAYGIESDVRVEIAHDPRAEIDRALMRAIRETDADLVVMASHDPSVVDYIWPSNGGKIAEHADCSVMVVRS